MGIGSQARDASSSVAELPVEADMDIQTASVPGRRGDSLGLTLVASGCTLLVAITWFEIFSNNPRSLGLFAFHPPLQTLAIALFACGILTLQPTSHLQPKAKVAGLNRHQLIILGLAFPCISVGTLVIIWNKNIHDAPHFVSWHGTFGIIAVSLMLGQMFLGAGSVWFGGKLFGGGAKAKGLWKYHRISGYLLFPFFLATIMIGGLWSTWTTGSISVLPRIFAYGIAPVAIIVGIWSRARVSKLGF